MLVLKLSGAVNEGLGVTFAVLVLWSNLDVPQYTEVDYDFDSKKSKNLQGQMSVVGETSFYSMIIGSRGRMEEEDQVKFRG